MTKEVVKETRWLVLSTDGRHVTLGRHRDPEPDEILRAENTLKGQSMSGWLVLMTGGYYTQTQPQLMMVRPLGEPGDTWMPAVLSFMAIWREANCLGGGPQHGGSAPG